MAAPQHKRAFLKHVMVSTSGPASYAAGGFDVEIGELTEVYNAVVNISGGYLAEVASISGNKVKVKVYYFDYDATADGPAIEVPDGTDLSGQTVRMWAEGI